MLAREQTPTMTATTSPTLLDEHGLSPQGRVIHNPTTAQLYTHALARGDGKLAHGGALVVDTGRFTGRSPEDKFVVDEPGSTDRIWWGDVNHALAEHHFEGLRTKVVDHLARQETLYVVDHFAGANPDHRVGVRVVTASPYHALFAKTMFIAPTGREMARFAVDSLVLHAPEVEADPNEDGTRGSTFVVLHPSRSEVLIGGTFYAVPAGPGRTRILLTTEGTYPYAMGGVTSWCDLLVRRLVDFDWQVLPVIAAHGRPPLYELPDHARELTPIELWSEQLPHGGPLGAAERRTGVELPAMLVRGLIAWESDAGALLEALLWCRRHPAGVRRAFRSRRAWGRFRAALEDVLDERVPQAGTPPRVDLVEASLLYQSLYWVARTAAVETPETDVLLVTAAGWAAVPALVHKALHDTPMILTEHGVYVREAYLAGTRTGNSPGGRFIATRLARGLACAAYAAADVVSPVTAANALWEQGLGVDPGKIHVVHNGLPAPLDATPAPGTRTVVSVGRIDPLKDVHTMLHAAGEALRHVPDATFRHYGPVTAGEESYGRSCRSLHEQLGLGARFRFMGRTTEPMTVVRAADVVLMTSISEALPMSILEAMGAGRPVVSTGVGGVRDVVKGCGVIAPPGDAHALAMGVVTLLRRPELAGALGRRGHRRLARIYTDVACVSGYRELIHAAAAGPRPTPRSAVADRIAA